MNNFPTLFELSLDVVTECFEIGIPPTNHVKISPEVCDQIFKTVMRIRDYYYDDHAKALIEMFQPKKLQLDFKKIQEGTFDEIRKLKLTELKIQNFEWISKYRVPNTEQGGSNAPSSYGFCIGRFLYEMLSLETREGLQVLDIWGGMSFGQNWMEELSSMFPNLNALNISCRKMHDADFTSLCNNFSNLRSLNIYETRIKNLNGLAKLQNLEYLNICELIFDTKEDIKDLFKLKLLKELVIGGKSDTRNYYWFFERPLPKLETLRCQWNTADRGFLRRILPNLPSLQTIVAHFTRLMQGDAPPRISLYTSDSAEAMLKEIGYFRSRNDWEHVGDLLFLFDDLYFEDWSQIEEESTPELIASMVNELEAIIEDFRIGRRVLPRSVDLFLAQLAKCADFGCRNADKLRILDLVMLYWSHHLRRTRPDDIIFKLLCEGLDTLIRSTKNFNADKVCSIAMQSIVHGGGVHAWEQICVIMIDNLLEYVDFARECYKNINFQKLHETLGTIRNSTGLLPGRKTSAGRVRRFVEFYM